ncbi:hypothetical protein QBC42DRAFT_282126 [Cladorrhinum samala]|uniref:Uncharacterized protein n=1 Tax=Cladorrhinum samala TaxID=585594 RepID=A0AAV9I4W2_9PEZI|nr:hypothetical protein QBC42DRAFT_282126 [Cladorrhinum samala]
MKFRPSVLTTALLGASTTKACMLDICTAQRAEAAPRSRPSTISGTISRAANPPYYKNLRYAKVTSGWIRFDANIG